MVKEVETNRFIPLLTPLFFGWTISLNEEKSLHILPLQSLPLLLYLSIPNPAFNNNIPHFQNQRCFNSFYVLLPYIISKERDKKYSRGVLHFVPLRLFYAVLFVPLFCRPREECGRLWRTTWLHNVDNIWQKDIKCILLSEQQGKGRRGSKDLLRSFMPRLLHDLITRYGRVPRETLLGPSANTWEFRIPRCFVS